MATGLEPVEGTLGIIGVSQQVAQFVFTIQAFCRDVRDAPADLQKLVVSLENLSRILIQLDETAHSTFGATFNTNADILRSSLQACHNAAAEISTFESSARRDLSKRRYRPSCVLVLKKREIRMMLENLERSKTGFFTAYTAFTHVSLAQQLNSLRLIQKQEPEGMQGRTINEAPSEPSRDDSCRAFTRFGWSRSVVISSRSRILRSVLPAWLCEQARAVEWHQAARQWNIPLKTSQTLGRANSALLLCMSGDLECIRRSLEERKLSVNDECHSCQ